MIGPTTGPSQERSVGWDLLLRPSWRGDKVGKMTCLVKCYKREVLSLDTQCPTLKVRNSRYAYDLDTREKELRRLLGAHWPSQCSCISKLRFSERVCLQNATKVGE